MIENRINKGGIRLVVFTNLQNFLGDGVFVGFEEMLCKAGRVLLFRSLISKAKVVKNHRQTFSVPRFEVNIRFILDLL